MPGTTESARTVRIRWVRSWIGFNRRQKEVVRSLGLRRLNQVVERPDTPQIRGIVAKIPHLVAVVSEALSKPLPGPEYTLFPPEVPAPREVSKAAEPLKATEEAAKGGESPAAKVASSAPVSRAKPAKPKKEEKPAKKKASKEPETKKGKSVATKAAKPSKPVKK